MFIRKWQAASSWLMLSALPACQQQGLAPAASNGASASALITAKPAPAVTPPATHALPPAEPAVSSPFIDGVRLGYVARLSVAGNGAVLATDKLLFAIHDDRVSIEPALLEGLHPQRSHLVRVFGSFPDSAWALEETYMERTSRSSLSRWTGSEWINADSLVQNKNVIGLSPWSNGRTLALVGDGYNSTLGFQQLGGARGVPLPQLARTAHDAQGCVHGVVPSAMTALSSGEVFLAGTQCKASSDDEASYGDVAVEVWGAGQARGKWNALPLLGPEEADSSELTSLIASSAKDAFVAGSRVPVGPGKTQLANEAYLAHFDGQSWHTLSTPPVEQINDLQRSPDGKLWALGGGELWATTGTASASVTWEHLALPALVKAASDRAVSSFWVRGNDDVWATVGTDAESYLLRTKPGTAALSVPGDVRVAELSTAFDPNAAYDCEQPTLVLLTLSRQAPKDADVPSVRAALRNHAEFEEKAQLVEFSFLTRRYLGIRGDAETLRDVAEVLSQSNIPGVQPEMRCLSEPITRTLTLDFKAVKRTNPDRVGALAF
jgi:hypothetical protein